VSKYDPLNRFLRNQRTTQVPMTFSQVEQVVGGKLPPSAYRHRPWWANEASGHVHAKAWLDAGYETRQVDMQRRKLVFERAHQASRGVAGMDEPHARFARNEDEAMASHPMIGALKGLLIIDADLDLAKPALLEWADLVDEKYGPERK
jgi:hypothetical protein